MKIRTAGKTGSIRKSAVAFGYTAPAIALMLLVFAYPLIQIGLLAFRRSGKFIGLANYKALESDTVFRTSLFNNLKLLALVPVIILISLVLAVVINERPRGWTIHRFVILIPFILPIPVSAIAIAAIVAYRGGLNQLLNNVGLDFLAIDWLGQANSSFFIICAALIWREIGFSSILIFSRLGNIDQEIVEAAEIDGAGWWRRLRYAILPQIAGVLVTLIVLEVITVFFYTFEWVYMLTRGGPAGSTMVVDLYIFQQAVQFRSIGIATAASSVVIILLLVILLNGKLLQAFSALRRRGRLIPKPLSPRSASMETAPRTPLRVNKSKRLKIRYKFNSTIKLLVSSSRHLMLLIFSTIFLIPLYFIVVNAFKTTLDYGNSPWSIPWQPTLRAFYEVFARGEILTWFRNSVVVTFGTVLLITITGILASYYISTSRNWINGAFRKIFLPLLAVPPIIIIVPLFVLFSNLGLINSFVGAIIVFTGLLLPFSCYLLLGFFDTFPKEILEAASMDGAGRLSTLFRVVLPTAKAAIGTQLVLNMLYVWNSLLIVLIFLQGNDRRTLAAGISIFQGRFFRDTPLVMAASLLVILPMFAVYLFAQRYFRRGIMAGAVK